MAKSCTYCEAELLAIEALAFIAGEQKLLERFVALSGIAPEAMRQAAAAPGFLAGVLGFLLHNEPDLLAFRAHTQRQLALVAQAAAQLPGGELITPKIPL